MCVRKHTKPFSVRPKTTTTHDTICGNCGVDPHKRQCPAYGQQCHACGRNINFARCCRTQTGQNKVSSKQYGKTSTRQYYKAPQKQINQFTGKYMPKVNKISVLSSSEDEYVYSLATYMVTCDIHAVPLPSMDSVVSCSLFLDPMSTYLTSSHFIE